MQRRSTTIGLIVQGSYVLQESVGVLSDLERGAAMFASGHTSRRVSSLRKRMASSRLGLVSVPPGLVYNTNYVIMYDIQG